MIYTIRRDGRVGRRRSPAKRVYWETGIEGSNPSLSAILFPDISLTPRMNVQNLLLALVAMWLVTACQGSSEQTPTVIGPTVSHQSAKEKTVVVPREVAIAWKAVKIAVIDKTSATENIYTIPIGGSSRIPSSNLTISIDAFLPSFVMEGSNMTSYSNKLKNPGVKVRISDNGSLIFKGWLFSNFRNSQAFMHPRFGFTLVDAVPVTK